MSIRGAEIRENCMQTNTSNQTLERTADRRANLLLMTSTLKRKAKLALPPAVADLSR